MTYRLLPHTADLRAAIDAATPGDLYDTAVQLVREILIGQGQVRPRRERRIRLDTDDLGERVFRFVRELLYLYDSEGFLPSAVARQDPLAVAGESFDPERHDSQHQVKALTRHGYIFRQDGDGFHIELVFDL